MTTSATSSSFSVFEEDLEEKEEVKVAVKDVCRDEEVTEEYDFLNSCMIDEELIKVQIQR